MKRVVKFIIIGLLATTILSGTAFASIPEGHWFESIVDTVIEKGFYPAVKDPSFNPDDYLTYSEFAKIATLALNRAIAYNGDKENDLITRYEVLRIINERLGYDASKLTQEQQILTAIKIADFNEMAQEEKNIALAAFANGLVNGNENGEFKPKDNATYAEVLTILSRINKNQNQPQQEEVPEATQQQD